MNDPSLGFNSTLAIVGPSSTPLCELPRPAHGVPLTNPFRNGPLDPRLPSIVSGFPGLLPSEAQILRHRGTCEG